MDIAHTKTRNLEERKLRFQELQGMFLNFRGYVEARFNGHGAAHSVERMQTHMHNFIEQHDLADFTQEGESSYNRPSMAMIRGYMNMLAGGYF